jgi:hypothetical protein
MHSELTLHTVPDDELLRRLHELAAHSRSTLADLVAHIGEVDDRRLYARSAFPSMFAYCTRALHLSESGAYKRITVARAARKHGVLLAMLRDGHIHLSGMALLAPLLTPENRDAVLARATHLSKRQIETLVAELSPRPDVPSVMRKLPEARPTPAPGAAQDRDRPSGEPIGLLAGVSQGPGATVTHRRDQGVDESFELVPGRVEAAAALELAPGRVDAATPAPSQRTVVEPLAPGRYKVQFTASAELHDKLERLAALMRSQVPDGDIGAIIERAVTEKLERLEARRFATSAAPRKTLTDTDTSKSSRHIPAAVRRAVRARDGDRCRFVDEQGQRCSERHRLEFHHRHPYGMGGDHGPENISLLCPPHNRYLAERDYGQAGMRRATGAKESALAPAST